MRAWIVALALVGCSSSNGEKEALKLANDLATDAVAKIDVAMKAGRPVDGIFDCVAAAMTETLVKAGGAYAELGTKLTRLCDHDVPLAAITKSVAEVEAARAKSPNHKSDERRTRSSAEGDAKVDDKMLTACVVNDIGFALKALKTPEEAKPLLARYAVACPDEKPF